MAVTLTNGTSGSSVETSVSSSITPAITEYIGLKVGQLSLAISECEGPF